MRMILSVALVALIALTAICGFSMVAKQVTPETSMQSMIDQHDDATIATIGNADPEGRDPGEYRTHRASIFSVSDENDDCSGPLAYYDGLSPVPI